MTFVEFKRHVEAAGLIAREQWVGHWRIIDGALSPVVEVWERPGGQFQFTEGLGPHKAGTLADAIAVAGARKTPKGD
jgi:hypothetical protein